MESITKIVPKPHKEDLCKTHIKYRLLCYFMKSFIEQFGQEKEAFKEGRNQRSPRWRTVTDSAREENMSRMRSLQTGFVNNASEVGIPHQYGRSQKSTLPGVEPGSPAL